MCVESYNDFFLSLVIIWAEKLTELKKEEQNLSADAESLSGLMKPLEPEPATTLEFQLKSTVLFKIQ